MPRNQCGEPWCPWPLWTIVVVTHIVLLGQEVGWGGGEMVAENLGSQCAFLVPTGMFPGNLVALFFPRLKGPDFLLCFLWHLQVSQALIPHLWSVWTYYLNAGRCGSEWGVNK